MESLTTINQKVKVIDSREVAEMMEISHWEVLRKLEGSESAKMVGIIPTLADNGIVVSDYFIESTYKDGSGKENKCYLFTKMGCEFIANKFNGEKGILFTAKYVKKFNEMEQKETAPPKRDSYMIENPIERAERWIEEQKEKQSLLLENKQKDQVIGELKPKADYTDSILKSKGLITITQIAKDYGMSAREFNILLHGLGIQFKQSGQWLLYSKYHRKGYTHSKTTSFVRSNGRIDVSMETKWTQKGRLFLYNLLKEKGILPVIEMKEEVLLHG